MEGKTIHPIDLEVGDRLRRARKLVGRSQKDLAKVLGITFQQVQKYELGRFDRFRCDRKCDWEIYQDIVFGQLYPKEVQELASVDCKAQWLEARLGKMSAKTALQISLS